MKFFIAAPWRSKELVQGLSDELMKRGYEVYSFLQNGANLLSGQSIVEEIKMFSDAMQNWQDNADIKRIFQAEMDGLKQSEIVLLLEPAGHSSLIEIGIGYGLGKRVIVVGAIEKPEVFYLIAEKIYPDIESFLADLSTIASK
jgi:hypothetical protein